MISRMFVSLTREDGLADNTLIRVLSVVASKGFQIQGARLHEHEQVSTAKLEVLFKGKSTDEAAARRDVMRVLSVSTLTEMREPALA